MTGFRLGCLSHLNEVGMVLPTLRLFFQRIQIRTFIANDSGWDDYFYLYISDSIDESLRKIIRKHLEIT